MVKEGSMVSPISNNERIESLDVLRGFAILGILVMNIQSYSSINASYINPTAYGDLTGINFFVWLVSHLFFDLKFLSLFSILFGAGIVLFSRKAESKGVKAAPLHYRRNFWLLVIGLIHAYFFWHGDILVPYAICGFLVFLFRNRKPKTLTILGILAILVPFLIYLFFGLSMRFWPPEAIEQLAASWRPGADLIEQELSAYWGGFSSQMQHRVPASLFFQTSYFLMFMGWRIGGLMLIGMALFKWGVLSGKRSRSFYAKWAVWGLLIGMTLILIGVYQNFKHDWSVDYSMFIGSLFNYIGSLFVTMAYLAIVVYWSTIGTGELRNRLAFTGRMAFSNYLGQTLICTFIFYGHGLGLFGIVERWQKVFIVLGIWVLQLLVSPLWLKHFRFGPVEWAWRSLTYWRIQPMGRGKED
jgi:uncharacterized protein